MTNQVEPDPIPGLEAPERGASSLELAVRRSIKALFDRGFVLEEHSARTALALELAQVIDLKHRTGKMSTIGNDARVLVELLDKIIPGDTSVDDRLKQLMIEWEEEAGADAP